MIFVAYYGLHSRIFHAQQLTLPVSNRPARRSGLSQIKVWRHLCLRGAGAGYNYASRCVCSLSARVKALPRTGQLASLY
jgi:hypothetical protein